MKTTHTSKLVPWTRRRRAYLLITVVALGIAGAANAQSSAELLEKGLYTEQTVGDLQAAIDIYTQVIENAEANRPHVAQAQYRLGLCYLKRGSDAETRAALDQLIREFPEQEQLVAQAREQLAAVQPALALGPVPWEDGEFLEYRITLPTGKAIGRLYQTAESAIVDGIEAWRLEQRKFFFTGALNQGVSRVLVDRHTQRPIHSAFRHGILGNADAVYRPGGVEITGGATVTQVDGDQQIYDNEQSTHLMRSLPFELGYEAEISFLATWAGEAVEVDLDVKDKEACRVTAGDFECYKVVLDLGQARQTLWLSTGPERYLVKAKANGVIMELVEIGRTDPGATVAFGLEDFGFSGVLPSRWIAYSHRETGRPNKAVIRLLDPDTEAISAVEVDRCPRGGCPSLQRSAERELAGARERFEAYRLREGSWTERTVDGRPAIGFAGDYLLNGKPWVQYRFYTFTEDVRLEFIFRTPQDRFDELHATFDSVVESVTAE